jgi:dTDP-4-amino-4,6-dideoxygalactose transaminase
VGIPFNRPDIVGQELSYLETVISNSYLAGNNHYTQKCQTWLEEQISSKKALLTHSCTAALEMAAILADIKPGDEVIMPSYTFVSTANAFVLRGGVPVFIDIRPDTMNMDETLIEAAITKRTRAIVPVHYAGVACEMDTIMAVAEKYNLLVIEDAAQAIMSNYKGKPPGSIGHLAAFSFHETKNIHCGEGGSILINDERFIERAEIIWEKGTNRSKFFRGEIDKYTWVDIGSSYLPNEITAAFLYAQMEKADEITRRRMHIWHFYYKSMKPLAEQGLLEIPYIPEQIVHNAHMFYIKMKDLESRASLIAFLRNNDVHSVFHYVPLHSSEAGLKCGRFFGKDNYTTIESERLLRLPLFFSLRDDEVAHVAEKINEFFNRLCE